MFVGFPSCLHTFTKVLQSVLKWLPPKTSLWEFDELSLEYFALHTETHTHSYTHALIQRACVWVLVCSGLGPGPGLAWVSFPLCHR